ncbi:4-nitrophenyl phosphatase/NagD protein [Lentzea fradiae]|uniref:4-nitrophenyl phosphatase/NagD protein n=1 Tax=Lentzea fradiae TaxID=200378 RepID=A0A1G8CT81_9PSEU|nr:HAD family hydrolase [Lentzea fradiae]SDH48658.1 4-nitrophenyl phosphatase/NagD protein [Lentzea fradiae]
MTRPTFLFDLDGTLLADHTALPGAVATVTALTERGHRVLYATNDAVLTVEQQVARLEAAGFPVTPDAVATSASTAAHVLADLAGGGAALRVLRLGAPAVEVEARSVDGVVFVDSAPADVVVAGLDTTLTYSALAGAVDALHRGARFLATNSDPHFTTAEGRRMPGAGAVVAALETASGATAEIVGKPGALMFRLLLERHGVGETDVVVVGDADADVHAARALGVVAVRLPSAFGTVAGDVNLTRIDELSHWETPVAAGGTT